MSEKDLAVCAPADILQLAIQQGAGVEQLERIMELKERHEANEARKAYNRAIAEFKSKNIKIIKKSLVDFQSSKGRTTYRHAKLGDAIEQIIEALSKCGLSHSWKTAQDGSKITVICRISHIDGHSEETPITAEPDTTGNKNSIQAIGSTITYLERYTLKAALGLAEHDDDGQQSGSEPVETISAEQLANLEALILETKTDTTKFSTFMKVDCVENIPASAYEYAVKALESKRGK